ncbi:MAG: sugar kinase, ribokinase [Candidatus Peregrinibacteria bacterium Gr01-1014_25]|nr:MAG: sugar kinase, ribokinase [Candidatus Peregrinibacteria bacterium Gr01-1014_25]
MRRVLVTGTMAYDHLFSYDASFLENLRSIATLDALSVSFYTHQYAKRHGGTGVNMAWNLQLLGRSPLLVADVGSDAEEYLALLQSQRIDTSHITIHAGELTSTGVSCTDTRQHQIWFFHRGADKAGAWPDLAGVRSNIAYAIVGQRHPPLMRDAVLWCKKSGLPVLFDPGQEIRNFTEEHLISAIDASTGIITNEYEWAMLHERLRCTPEELAKRVAYVVVTQAERGHSLYTREGGRSFPRCDCDVFVNPTGAGDAFRAGLLTGLTEGWALEIAARLGAALASFVCQQEGTHLQTVDLDKVYERARAAYGEALPPLAS